MRPQPLALRPAEDPSLRVSGSSLDGYFVDRAKILKGMLDEIDGQIEGRQALIGSVAEQQGRRIAEANEELMVLERYPLSQDRWLDQRRAQVRTRLEHHLQLQEANQVQGWGDIARRTAERRNWKKEYGFFRQKARMIG